MLAAPTDNLYKFMAIFGLVIIFSSSAFWWKSSNEFERFFESNLDYINNNFKGAEAYEKFAKKTNEAIAIINSVAGDKTKLTDKQKKELKSILSEASKLQEITDSLLNNNPAQIIVMQSRVDKYDLVDALSLIGVILGVLISVLGFYLWHTRLQKYIDELHKIKNV